MFLNFFGHKFGKVSNKNDMLGFLIANMDSQKEVKASFILNKLNDINLDNPSANMFLKSLSTDGYIIYSTDVITVLKLGENNYLSIWKQILRFFIRRIWDLIVFLSGIVSGVLIAYLTHILIK